MCACLSFFLVSVEQQHNFTFKINLLWVYFMPDFSWILWNPRTIVTLGKQDSVTVCSVFSNSVYIWLLPVYSWQWTILIAGSRILGLYFRTALATFLAYFVYLVIKKKFILTRKAISWGYVSRRSGFSSLTWLAPLYELKWQILNPKITFLFQTWRFFCLYLKFYYSVQRLLYQ